MNYWEKRALEREQHWYDLTTAELDEKIKRYYEQSLEAIQRDIEALYGRYATENGLTMLEARRLIRGKEYKRWRMTLEEYVKAARNDSEILKELNTLAMRSRITRLEKLMSETLMELDELCEKTNDFLTSFLSRVYYDNYYKSLYDLHRKAGLKEPPVKVDSEQVGKVIRTAWSGANYSTRIWANGTKLASSIEEMMKVAIHRGISTKKLSMELSRRMDVGYNNAERLIRTELNYVQNKAAADSMIRAGLEEYRFVATLDHRTCGRCGSLDGQVFELETSQQGENYPPIHPRCRCTVIPVISGDRAAKVKGKRVGDISYSEWKAEYVDKAIEKRRGERKTEFNIQRFGGQHLPEGDYNLRIRRQVQNRHIEGTKEYQDYVSRKAETQFKPSKMPPETNAQGLVNEFHNKGIYEPNPKDGSPREAVDTGRIIGQYWNNRNNQFIDTTWLMIVYAKSGTHVYPIRPKEDLSDDLD